MTVQSRTTTVERTRSSAPVVISGLQFADEDKTFPYRIVGSYEYGTSLSNFGKLVDSSTPEQIEVYDKLIGMKSEYSFYSGVASNMGLDTDFSSLDQESSTDVESSYLKHSLAWMMALARVELGATMSMYGDGMEDPFGKAVTLGGVGFGSEEYLSVLVDDVAAHLKAVQNDDSYIRTLAPEEEVGSLTLNHLRRTQLINDMLGKVISSQIPEIVAVAGPYAEVAQRYVDDITKKIDIATTTIVIPSLSESATQSFTRDSIVGLRFQNRQNLLACQRNLESRFPPPAATGSPLE